MIWLALSIIIVIGIYFFFNQKDIAIVTNNRQMEESNSNLQEKYKEPIKNFDQIVGMNHRVLQEDWGLLHVYCQKENLVSHIRFIEIEPQEITIDFTLSEFDTYDNAHRFKWNFSKKEELHKIVRVLNTEFPKIFQEFSLKVLTKAQSR
jgi:hypothetical protein